MSQSGEQREAIARTISEEFNKLNPDQKRNYVDDTLTSLVNMKKKEFDKLFKKFVKKGKPSAQDLETVNQIIVVFLHSVKDEFRYHYATMIYKSLKVPIPEDLPEKLVQVRQLKWLHFGLSPEVYDSLFAEWVKQKQPSFDVFFTNLVNANANGKKE
jgi:uncharacterized protein YdeI (YjbR/CyaY-like superfamily)